MARLRDREPELWRGEWLHPSAGTHSYPPRRARFDPPRRTCPHCGLPAQTDDARCPVCAARYFPTWRARLRAWWRSQ
jgi:hypothetical protein